MGAYLVFDAPRVRRSLLQSKTTLLKEMKGRLDDRSHGLGMHRTYLETKRCYSRIIYQLRI